MLAFSLASAQHQFGHVAGPLPRSIIVPLAVLAIILFAVKYFGVIAHEGAHAIAGWSMGRKVDSVMLNSDGTGATRTLGPDKGLGRIFTAFAGYRLGDVAGRTGDSALLRTGKAGWPRSPCLGEQ